MALALVLTAKSDFAQRTIFDPTDIVFVPTKPPPPPPPPPPAEPAPPRQSMQSVIDTPPVIIPTPAPNPAPIAEGPPVTANDPLIGNAVEPQPLVAVVDPPRPALVHKAARFATPADLVRPPYPAAKQQREESASLRLTLAIDARGRVTAVTPVGSTDPVFLDAARRHILRYWRYQPAMEGDTAVASSATVTLRFELEE
jgi:protein TonB